MLKILIVNLLIYSLVAKKALIFGINGQDGFYLKSILESKSYNVVGVSRKSELSKNIISCNYENIQEIISILERELPDEIYNLAAVSSVVQCSYDLPTAFKVNSLFPAVLLEAIKLSSLKHSVRFFQAGSSEIFGSSPLEEPQNESTKFSPDSIYGLTKLTVHNIVKFYRNYGIFAVNGILYNHESSIRPNTFVTKKISEAVLKIINNELDCLIVGNIDNYRDWSHAKDIAYGIYLSLQADKPDDYIFASGEKHSVREFIEKAFLVHGIKIIWYGEGLDEVGIDSNTNKILIKKDSKFYREVLNTTNFFSRGDSTKAQNLLGWRNQISFDDIVKEMCQIF